MCDTETECLAKLQNQFIPDQVQHEDLGVEPSTMLAHTVSVIYLTASVHLPRGSRESILKNHSKLDINPKNR